VIALDEEAGGSLDCAATVVSATEDATRLVTVAVTPDEEAVMNEVWTEILVCVDVVRSTPDDTEVTVVSTGTLVVKVLSIVVMMSVIVTNSRVEVTFT